jgi:hypothetical protein
MFVDTNRRLAAKQASIVDKYADAASDVYAPVQRAGRFPDTCPPGRPIETEHFVPGSAAGLQALEAFLPKGALEPRNRVRSCSTLCNIILVDDSTACQVWNSLQLLVPCM